MKLELNDKEDFTSTAEYWQVEISAAEKEVEKWHKQGEKVVKKFLDERNSRDNNYRLNLFTANVQTLRAMLYGNTPSVNVSRRYADANDDVARVSAEMLERLLNSDIEESGEGYEEALMNGLSDLLLPGLGVARVRYEAEFEESVTAAIIGEDGIILADEVREERKIFEEACIDYVYWKDFLWSPARTWADVRWVAFKAEMSKEEVAKRFGEDKANILQYHSSKNTDTVDASEDPWQHAFIWEIWDKSCRKVVWWSKGCQQLLDCQEDPLELNGFFPCPKPMFANLTTSKLLPKPEYTMAQDQYIEIDVLTTRITMLQKAVKAVGVYDKSSDGVQRMMNEAYENQLIPVDNWALFAEKGGLQGTVVWMPLADIVNAMDKLRDYRNEVKQLLYEVTGMSDIMRGAQTMGQATATEQLLKSRFGSVRVQQIQNRFVEFATDLQRLRAEIICNHFDDKSIVLGSNMQYSHDVDLIPQALQLLRDEFASYRINIESEQMAQIDKMQLNSERMEYLDALTKFITTAMPAAQTMPGSLPFLLELMKWGLGSLSGANQIEGVIDRAIETAKKQAENPQQQPSPEELKAQMEMQKQQMKSQAKMQEIQAKTQADMQKAQASVQADMMKAQVNLEADKQREANQAFYNIKEEQAKAELKRKDDYIRRMAGGA
jgi:hypothetical protein